MQFSTLGSLLALRPQRILSAVALCGMLLTSATAFAAPFYQVKSLVTDDQAALAAEGFGPAAFVDPNLVNPWGISFSPTGPFWVANQLTGTSTLYDGAGTPFPPGSPLVVDVPQNPAPGFPAGATGTIFNGSDDFQLSTGGKSGAGRFFFSNLDGSISGWNSTGDPTQAVVVVPPATAERPAIYTGLAVAASGGSNYLYAPNGITGKIDVFDADYNPVVLPGGFVDPTLPAGLEPFNIQNIDGLLYVTYAIPGPAAINAELGQGAVSVFAPDGTFIMRIATGGLVTSPWGVAIAPEDFGPFGNALLVGNFHNEFGYINAFDPTTGAHLGTLSDAEGDFIHIPGLWALIFGNGGLGGDPDDLYFTAGLTNELHGLFGLIQVVPEPGSAAVVLTGLGLFGFGFSRRSRRTPQAA